MQILFNKSGGGGDRNILFKCGKIKVTDENCLIKLDLLF